MQSLGEVEILMFLHKKNWPDTIAQTDGKTGGETDGHRADEFIYTTQTTGHSCTDGGTV